MPLRTSPRSTFTLCLSRNLVQPFMTARRHVLWPGPGQYPCLPMSPSVALTHLPPHEIRASCLKAYSVPRSGGPSPRIGRECIMATMRSGAPTAKLARFLKKPQTRKTLVKVLLTSKKTCHLAHFVYILLHRHRRTDVQADSDVQNVRDKILFLKENVPKGDAKKFDTGYCKDLTADVHDAPSPSLGIVVPFIEDLARPGRIEARSGMASWCKKVDNCHRYVIPQFMHD
ncbi:hypothetical protein K488DRAFT_74780 [Vararia minispora EC-137]|uniref:Uncharacterized protein n=1 Tax=Vararia minispora EC-137 TaxID=1314806 RepID=A0ACB8Q679_9AGAM|nr:hypothetical protein K488DRAFT_74780 [Vararia minispora EC-137]